MAALCLASCCRSAAGFCATGGWKPGGGAGGSSGIDELVDDEGADKELAEDPWELAGL